MASGCVLQLTGLILGGVGMVGTLAATAMPQWRVSAHVEGNLVVFESIWEGLWMGCVSRLGLRLQCQLHGSWLALPPALAACRALMCAAVALAALALLLAAAGLRRGPGSRPGLRRGPGSRPGLRRGPGSRPGLRRGSGSLPWLRAAGGASLLAGALALLPVSWAGGSIVRDFRDPRLPAPLKRELGTALFVGWASAALLLAAGAIHCRCCCGAAHPGHPRLPRAPAQVYV